MVLIKKNNFALGVVCIAIVSLAMMLCESPLNAETSSKNRGENGFSNSITCSEAIP